MRGWWIRRIDLEHNWVGVHYLRHRTIQRGWQCFVRIMSTRAIPRCYRVNSMRWLRCRVFRRISRRYGMQTVFCWQVFTPLFVIQIIACLPFLFIIYSSPKVWIRVMILFDDIILYMYVQDLCLIGRAPLHAYFAWLDNTSLQLRNQNGTRHLFVDKWYAHIISRKLNLSVCVPVSRNAPRFLNFDIGMHLNSLLSNRYFNFVASVASPESSAPSSGWIACSANLVTSRENDTAWIKHVLTWIERGMKCIHSYFSLFNTLSLNTYFRRLR